MARDTRTPREKAEELEKALLGPHATRSTDERAITRTHRYHPDPFRTEFERDYTRIIHSRSFRRLRHKTQVFISPRNDHLCTRLEHSLHVASVANTIAKALRLNTELVAAIAVGHDVGHAPFGHEGERCLDKLAKEHGLTGFAHELQSLHVVDELDSPYRTHRGLNLTFAVRDGIACHHGEGFEPRLEPDRRRGPDKRLTIERGKTRPATLEGCVVRWADKVAYIGRDLEDALTVKLLRKREVPDKVRKTLGTSNREIIASLVRDIVVHSDEQDLIAVSDDVHEALNELYSFSVDRIYNSPMVTDRFKQVRRAMEFMFGEFLRLVESARGREDRRLFKDHRGVRCIEVLAEFLKRDVRAWREEKPPRLVVDFIAGMTDSFFEEAFKELFLPGGSV